MHVQSLVLATDGARPLNADGSRAPGRAVDPTVIQRLVGGDVWAAGAIRRRDKPDEARIRAALESDTLIQNGKWLIAHIEGVLSADRDRTIKKLACLCHCFPFVTLRIPAVADYLDRTGLNPQDQELDLLLQRFTPRRGRPVAWVQQLQVCCWLDQLHEEHKTYTQAAQELRRLGVTHHDASSLRTLRSNWGKLPRVFAQGYFVPACLLRPAAWGAQPQRWTLYMPHSEVQPVAG